MFFLMFLITITWEYKTSAPAGRVYPATGTVVGTNSSGRASIYVIGGVDATGLNQTRTNYEYDCITDNWAAKLEMPTPVRYDFAGCNATRAGVERIYVIGGYDGAGILADVDEYTPSTDAWNSRAGMPTAREGVRAACIGNMIYATGGDDPADPWNPINTVERYDPETNIWTTGYTPMPTARTDPCCAVALDENSDSCIYVFGGCSEMASLTPTNAVEEYNPATGNWRPRNSAGFTARWGSMAVTDKYNNIYVIGGTNDGMSSLNLVQVYDPVADSWSPETPIQVPRDGITGGLGGDTGGRIYVVVGANGMTVVTTNERTTEIVGVEESVKLDTGPNKIKIYPNPFSKLTNISFGEELRAERIALKIYDVSGKLVKSFNLPTPYAPRPTHISWDGMDNSGHPVPEGVYFIQLHTPGKSVTKKVIKLK